MDQGDNYEVCIGNDITELHEAVNMKLRQGYRCQGGICVLRYEFTIKGEETDAWWFYQAMVRASE